MTFKLNQQTVAKRRYGGGFSFPSGSAGPSILVTGGIASESETHFYRTFLSSDSLSVSGGNLPVEVFSVAGGGQGGFNQYMYWSGKGGGAGGVISGSLTLSENDTYAVVVGAGAPSQYFPPAKGSNSKIVSSSLGTVFESVGGGGASDIYGWEAPIAGGSGPGGTGLGYFDPVQGNSGGAGNGGGGGAGQPGQDGQAGGTQGGDGTPAYSDWGLATGTGELVAGTYYYAGGGCGNGWNEPVFGRGGYGGGGGAQRPGSGYGIYPGPSSGLANTGGGGSAACHTYGGQNGGSGLVIIRYLKEAV